MRALRGELAVLFHALEVVVCAHELSAVAVVDCVLADRRRPGVLARAAALTGLPSPMPAVLLLALPPPTVGRAGRDSCV